MGRSTFRPTSLSHHHINLLVPGIRSDPVHISYMGRQATCTAMVACLCWVYTLIGHIPEVSSASTTRGHSHSPPVVCCTVIPMILLATQLWNPSINFSISPFATKLLLPYNITDCTTALYSIPSARTFAPVFITTFPANYHRRRTFQQF